MFHRLWQPWWAIQAIRADIPPQLVIARENN